MGIGVAWAEFQRPHETLGTNFDLKSDKLPVWKQVDDSVPAVVLMMRDNSAGLGQIMETRREADELETYFRGRLEFPCFLPCLVSSSS